MFAQAGIVLGVMVVVYVAVRALRLSTELSMLASALGGALAGGHPFPARHVAEGAITYLDINLIFITATLFMNVLKESGGVVYVVRGIVSYFQRSRALLLVLLTILLLVPGALTGAGSVTVLVTGSLVAVVLHYMGISQVRASALIFVIAGLSAAAPPISLWAMMTAAGVNMPYVGFFWPLLVPCVAAGILTSFILGWKSIPGTLHWGRMLVAYGACSVLNSCGYVFAGVLGLLSLPGDVGLVVRAVLLAVCLVWSVWFITFVSGWKGEPIDAAKALEELPRPAAAMSWWRVALPFVVFGAFIWVGRQWPHSTPITGLPLMFAAAALVSVILSPVRLDLVRISRETIAQLLPLLATLTCAGILVQIMTLTGARGLLAVATVSLPVAVIFGTLFLVLPVSEAVLMWGAAPVLGVPLVLLFNKLGLNPIVALAGMSVIWPLGDALPPTAIIGRLTVNVVGYKGPYGQFLKACAVPAILIIVIGTLMVMYSRSLGFLTGL